jgi:hypothetical protein
LLVPSARLNGALSACCRRSAIGAGIHERLLGEHDELVAADPAERVGVAQQAVDARCDRLQQLVAAAVSEHLVDAGEPVHVDVQGGDRRAEAARAAEHLLGAVEHQRAVRQARQLIVRGHEGELLLAALQLFLGLDALALVDLAHVHQRHVKRDLGHGLGLAQGGAPDSKLLGGRAQGVVDAVAPA